MRRCGHCGRSFSVDPRVAWRQRYCPRWVCKAAGRVVAQKRWLRKAENRDHFKGRVNLVRVQDWRKVHPGYWRRRARVGQYLVRGRLAEMARQIALQDEIDTHFSLVVGLVSHLTKSALQDEIARELSRLMLLGHGILTQTTTAPGSPAGTDPNT